MADSNDGLSKNRWIVAIVAVFAVALGIGFLAGGGGQNTAQDSASSSVVPTTTTTEPTTTTTSNDLDSLRRYIDVLEQSNAQLQRELDQATSIMPEPEASTSTTIPKKLLSGEMRLVGSGTNNRLNDLALLLDADRRVCTGINGYNDLRAGASVVVSDGAGDVVATSALSEGLFDEYSYVSGINSAVGICVWAFAVEVPANLDFYTIEVSHRGGITLSIDDLETDNWFVSLSM